MDSNLHTGHVATRSHRYSGSCPKLRFHVSGVAQVISLDVYLPEDSTGGTAADPNVTPSSYVSYHVWEYRDWETRGYQRLRVPLPAIGSAALVNEEATSSLESSVPDGAWREPSPPPFYDPWNDSD